MWCSACQQDVPGLAVPEEPGVVRCTFCAEELTTSRGESSGSSRRMENAAALATAIHLDAQADVPRAEQKPAGKPELAPSNALPAAATLSPPAYVDDWELESDLRAVERVVGILRRSPAVATGSFHTAHSPVSSGDLTSASSLSTLPQPEEESRSEKSGLLAWSCLSLGVMALACGAVLLIWSFAANRGDLWSLGLPLAIIGQAGLVVGLLLQLDGLWKNTRRTQQTLSQLGDRLLELHRAAPPNAPAESFRAQLSQPLSPHLQLADLKGQLDALSRQMAHRH